MNSLYIESLLNKRTFISYLLYPFSLLYIFIVCLRRFIFGAIPRFSYRSRCKIISIGNITTGGSGKTPFVLYLANELKEKHKIAIVLRGYKGDLENTNTLISDYTIVYDNVARAGDEAILYATNLKNVPICVGKNRVKSIRLLEDKFPELEMVLMDDAFQYLKVKQDTKICIFKHINPISNGFCLPAGLLREPMNSLKYADYLVINGDMNLIKKEVLDYLQKYKKPILNGDYQITSIKDRHEQKIDIESLKKKKLVLLSGIGSPKSFENTIKNADLTFFKHIQMPDHFHYTQIFLDKLNTDCDKQYDYILTTEKDYTKIQYIKHDLPILVVTIKFGMTSVGFSS